MAKEISTQNTREIDKRINSAILKAMATTGLCNIAPLLSLARTVNACSNIGMTYSTCVDDVQVKDMGSYMVMRIVLSTATCMENVSSKTINVLYTFRMITQSIFEPFIYISKDINNQVAFAYVDEEEFLFSQAEDSEEDTLVTLHCEAQKTGKKSLVRYIDLIRIGFIKGKPWRDSTC